MKINALTIIISALILEGCFDQYKANQSIEECIAQTKKSASERVPQQKISAMPTTKEILNNKPVYLPQGRDPFSAERHIYTHGYIFPKPEPVRTLIDPTRPKGYKLEPLEKYELKQLTMIGAISQSDGEFSALIDLGEGKIITIRKGDYIGKDHGIITKITENKIVISEKFSIATKEMPDAWIEQFNEIHLKTKIAR